jgi:prepilin-type N-terminal cleavage/methylation domain-containing protein
MKKKGFTLIEMMAAIVILAVIALLVVPLVEQTILNIRQDSYNNQIESIRQSARRFGADNINLLPGEGDVAYQMTLEQLKEAGYAKKDIRNPITGDSFPSHLEIRIENVNGNLVYIVGGNHGGELSPNTPTITVDGPVNTVLGLGQAYIERGAIAKSPSGTNISYTTEITKDGNIASININQVGTYIVTYSTSFEGLTAKTRRTVNIVDNVPPIISATPLTITTATTTINMMQGVTTSDNSGLPVVVTYTDNLILGVVGVYQIEYTATDASGNKTIITRTITIQ